MKPRILVTAAAGKTGFATAQQLLEKGYPVRAFVRRPGRRAELLYSAGAEVFTGNMFDMRDVRNALAGVQRAYFCAPFAPNPLHVSTIFAAAAQEARLEMVTKITQWFAQPSHPSFATREHWLADQIMPWMPDVNVATIDPGLFADVYFLVLAPIAQLGLMPLPLGDGLNAPPSNEDIARVAVGSLIDPAPHIGKSYLPTGPKLLSPSEIASIFARVLDRPVRYMNTSDAMFAKAATVQGFPIYEIAQARHYFREHRRTALTVNAPNDAVRTVGGRAPEDFETIARRTVAERPEAVRSLGNKLAALRFLARLLVTQAPDLKAYERRQNHPEIADPLFSSDSDEWLAARQGRPAVAQAS